MEEKRYPQNDEVAKFSLDGNYGFGSGEQAVNGEVIKTKNSSYKDLMKYATSNKIPTLAYPGKDFAQAYEEFYEKIYTP